MTFQEVKQQFPEPRYAGLLPGKCPNCYSHNISSDMELEGNQDNMTTVSVSTNDDIESRLVEELDEHGNPIMIQTGERYEMRVNQQTGQIYSEPVPVYEPKMRELTAQEIAERKTQRDQSLSELDSIAV